MRYLINLCSHDGIVSHYTGVGSIVQRYIQAIERLSNDDITLNLFTPEYRTDSFGYSESMATSNKDIASRLNGEVFQISNGTNGKVNYGTINQWRLLCQNTAVVINTLDTDDYDIVLNIFNDTPFSQLSIHLKPKPNFRNIWIPHSTVMLHGVDSALRLTDDTYYVDRLKWEKDAIDYANSHSNCYVGTIGRDFGAHLERDYGLQTDKNIAIHNGVIERNGIRIYPDDPVCSDLLDKIDQNKAIMLSYARAEPYKNLEYTMRLGEHMGDSIQTIVIAQSYYMGQPILDEYRKLAQQTGTLLFIDPPFSLPQYIIEHSKQPIILLVPSHKEAMGLIINETRSRNDPNILVVANDVEGLREQIEDCVDGLLINTNDNYKKTADKILEAFVCGKMSQFNKAAQKKIAKEYDLVYNISKFIHQLASERSTSHARTSTVSARKIGK